MNEKFLFLSECFPSTYLDLGLIDPVTTVNLPSLGFLWDGTSYGDGKIESNIGTLTRSTAPSPAFEGGVEKRRSGSTLSKPQPSGWGAEGLTIL